MPTHPSEHKMSEQDTHREAHVIGLRLALGSILSPKRPPLHHSSSGTSSPMASYSAGPETPPLPPPPPHSTPAQPQAHLHHPHPHAQLPTYPQTQQHAHTPSRLSYSHSSSSSTHPTRPPSPSPPSTPGVSTPPLHHHHSYGAHSDTPAPTPHHDAVLPPAVVAVPEPMSISGNDAEAGAKRAHFLATLQSKSAWDAMVHGSWV